MIGISLNTDRMRRRRTAQNSVIGIRILYGLFGFAVIFYAFALRSHRIRTRAARVRLRGWETKALHGRLASRNSPCLPWAHGCGLCWLKSGI